MGLDKSEQDLLIFKDKRGCLDDISQIEEGGVRNSAFDGILGVGCERCY